MLVLLLFWSCSSSRHVPDGSYLLDKVSININDSTHTFNEQEMSAYLRQVPNHKMLWSVKFRLGIYNMSGNDSTKWWNKWARKLGEAPVIFDSTLMEAGSEQLRKAMVNRGFLEATVTTDTLKDDRKKKIQVNYTLNAGEPHIINSIDYNFPDSLFRALVMSDSTSFPIQPGDPLDRNALDMQRELITILLRNKGYYNFAKEFITFNADTTEGSKLVDLTMTLNPPYKNTSGSTELPSHEKYLIRNVRFITDYDAAKDETLQTYQASDTVYYKGMTILYGDNKYLRPSVLYENCFIQPGE